MKHKLPVISEWASLVTQWLRIPLPIQGTWVRSLVWDPTCSGATKQAPGALRLCSATREATAMRSPHTETRVAPLTATRENRSPHSNEDPVQPKINKSFLKKQKMSHRDIMYSTGNIVNNIVILLYGDRW